jgi:hypothetical protein
MQRLRQVTPGGILGLDKFHAFYQLPLSIDEVTESMLLNAWSTGAAFQCAHDQPVIDGFFVGYYGPLDRPFRSSNLITIPWQSRANLLLLHQRSLVH